MIKVVLYFQDHHVSLMDMHKLMTANNCNRIVLKLTNSTKSVAENTIVDGAQELNVLKKNNIVLNSIHDNSVNGIDVLVSSDDTWQR